MAFSRPSLATLVERAQSDAEARLRDGAPVLPVSNLAVLARVLAGAVHGLYGYLAWLADQILPDTAEAEWLARHAEIRGVSRVAASYAEGSVTMAGTAGATVPAEARLRRADGVEYLVTAAIALGSGSVPVRATVAGAGGDAAAGTALTLVSPVSGVASGATVAPPGLTGGADQEGDEALRARVLERIRRPPQGGAAHDYVAWALAAHPAVTRAWCYPEEVGAGTVTVRVMADGETADGIPSETVVAAVQAALDAARPVTAVVCVVAPIPAPLDFGLAASPNSVSVRAAIEAALSDLISAEAVPGGTLPISHIRAAISGAAGEEDYALSSPAADVPCAVGHIVTMGAVVWA